MVAPFNPNPDQHHVVLRGAWPRGSSSTGPTLLERKDEDFIAALLEELQSANPAQTVAAQRPVAPSNGKALRLFQPVHRVFNLALVEAHCDTFGAPRLDPQKIDSAGIVVRRLALDHSTGDAKRDNAGRTIFEGWLADHSRVTGWRELLPGAKADADPDPARRPPPRLTMDSRFDFELLGGPPRVAEVHNSIFVAPPASAENTGRTVLYGVIPVTSTSRGGAIQGGPEPPMSEWREHLSILIKAGPSRQLDLPASGNFAPSDLQTYSGGHFMTLFRQLCQEFRLFDVERSNNARSVITELNYLAITLPDDTMRPLGTYLESVARILRDEDSAAPAVPRPKLWPQLTLPHADRIHALLRATATDVLGAMIAPAAGRFDEPRRLYAVRAFVRVKCESGCPPKIVWSDYSEPFEIAPWFEPGPVAPAHVALPDPFDREFLKKARPGVAFSVPASLARFLNQNAKDMVAGNAQNVGGPAIDWICGFNIPIITICAFIVLSIFLSLFDLIFRWLLLVKICIPFPRKK